MRAEQDPPPPIRNSRRSIRSAHGLTKCTTGAMKPQLAPRALSLVRESPSSLFALAASPAATPAAWYAGKEPLLASAAALLLLLPVLLRLPRNAAITSGAIVCAVVQMAFDAPAEQALLETVVVLVAANVISMKDALAGFKSEGVVSVAVMCAVAKSVQVTGGIQLIARFLLGQPTTRLTALIRLLLPILGISALMNNTPVCAMMIPIVQQWGASLGFPAAQTLMPVSFATMLGGTLTLIGSSTNLVAANAGREYDPTFSMGMFDISRLGVINAAAGLTYMLIAGRHLLPGGDAPFKPPAPTKKAVASPPPPRGAERMWLTLGLLAATMSVAARQPSRLVHVALGCLCVLIRCGCIHLNEAWGAVNGPVLLSIALSFALGAAIEKSQLATIVAAQLVKVVAPMGSLAILFSVYLVATLVGAVISNNAVVVLMFPVVVKVCEGAGIPWKPAFYALTMAASASFSTPVSYQTNLMVTPIGGYSFNDFLRFGLPLQLVCMLATVPACHLLYSS